MGAFCSDSTISGCVTWCVICQLRPFVKLKTLFVPDIWVKFRTYSIKQQYVHLICRSDIAWSDCTEKTRVDQIVRIVLLLCIPEIWPRFTSRYFIDMCFPILNIMVGASLPHCVLQKAVPFVISSNCMKIPRKMKIPEVYRIYCSMWIWHEWFVNYPFSI